MSKTDIDVSGITAKVVTALQNFIGHVPTTSEPKAVDPKKRSQEIATMASAKAAAVSGTLALPPGPLGMLTIIPDLLTVWKIQAQMVVDIAGAFGKQGFLSQEQMLYCLFKHAAAQAMRDIVVRVGERLLVRRATLKMMQVTLQKVGVKVTQRIIGKSATRWLGPLAALGVAGYAYYDTAQVAKTSIEFFGCEIEQSSDEYNAEPAVTSRPF
jgi:Co/Zn/Cd efflux system component